MNKYEIVEQKRNIENMIFEMRGVQVIIDSDVAYLYKTETKKINQIVKRNKGRFPEYFCFRLTENEYKILRCQNGTLKKFSSDRRGEHKKYLPLAFTEYGITMLAGLLKSDIAVEISIRIINTFIGMKNFIRSNANILARLDNYDKQFVRNDVKFLEYDKNFNKIFTKLNNKTEVKEKIFFNGQIYDAYSLLVKIMKQAKESVVVIDNYIDNTILDILSKKREKVDVLIVADRDKCKLNNLDIEKFNKQYPTLRIKYNNNFHDRFIILDNKVLYHCGASIKDIGNKCFGISEIHDRIDLQSIIKEIEL